MSERRGSAAQQSPLKTDRGSTSIQDPVVAQVAGIAAQQIEGVQMGGGTSAAVTGFLGNVSNVVTGAGSAPGGGNAATGVSVEVGEEEVAVDLTMAVQYGYPVPRISEAVRNNVIRSIESLVGLRVAEVNITVNDVQFQEERPMLGRQREVEEQSREQERKTGNR